jgi:hypothetical protein
LGKDIVLITNIVDTLGMLYKPYPHDEDPYDKESAYYGSPYAHFILLGD